MEKTQRTIQPLKSAGLQHLCQHLWMYSGLALWEVNAIVLSLTWSSDGPAEKVLFLQGHCHWKYFVCQPICDMDDWVSDALGQLGDCAPWWVGLAKHVHRLSMTWSGFKMQLTWCYLNTQVCIKFRAGHDDDLKTHHCSDSMLCDDWRFLCIIPH